MSGNRLAVNILSLTTSQVIVKLINVAVSIAVVRSLGTDELGRYAYVLALAYPFGALADFGLGTFAIREMSRNPGREPELFPALQRALFGLAGLGWLVLIGVGVVLHAGDPLMLVSLALAGLANVLSAVTTPMLAVLTSREHLHRVAIYQVTASLLGSLAIVAALAAGGATVSLLLAATIANLCMWAVAYRLVGRLPERVPVATEQVLALIRDAAPFGLLLIAFALYYRVDMLILQWLRDAREVGLYAAAYRFLDVCIPLAASLGRPFFPRFSSLEADRDGGVSKILDVTWRVLLAVGLPLTVLLFLAADPLVLLVFGSEFAEAGALLKILVWGGLPLFLIVIPVQALMARNRALFLAAVYGASAALNMVLNLALIPRLGATGAAVATVCCEWFNLSLVMLMAAREFPFTIAWGRLWRYGAAAAGMAVTVWWLQKQALGLQAGAGGAAYVLTLAVLNRFHFQEVSDSDACSRTSGRGAATRGDVIMAAHSRWRSLLSRLWRTPFGWERRLVRALARRHGLRLPAADVPAYASGEDTRIPYGVPNRSGIIALAFEFMAGNVMQGDYFEFGCWGGRTFRMAYAHHRALFDGKMHFWLFDSFTGLPALSPVDRHPKWREGDYCTPRVEFERLAAEDGIPPDRYTIVEGFYQDTLTPTRAAELASRTKAGVVYIDCDLYESTRSALEFVRPLLQQGTVLCFDDYYCFNGRPDKGEQLAIAEFLARHPDVTFVDYVNFGWHGRSVLVHLREGAGSR